MTKKIFGFFLILSILVLAGLGGFYYYEKQQNLKAEPNVIVPNVQGIPNEEGSGDSDAEPGKPTY